MLFGNFCNCCATETQQTPPLRHIVYSLHSVVVCRSGREYWFGLYKKNAARGDAMPGITTYWLDGKPSTFRKWHGDEPDSDARCVRYSEDGFKDRNCSKSYYFTCKMNTGKLQKARLEQKLLFYHRCAILLSSVVPLQSLVGSEPECRRK